MKSPILLGKIVGLYGVQGWVRVFSYTRPPENILQYNPWWMLRAGAWQEIPVQATRRMDKTLVASFAGYSDRERAKELLGTEVGIMQEQLPALSDKEFYWAEL